MDTYTNYLDTMPDEMVRKTMIEMEPDALQNLCRMYKRAATRICNDETFWMDKYHNDFEGEGRVQARTWKEAYDIRNTSNLNIPWTGVKAQTAERRCGYIQVPSGKFILSSGLSRMLGINNKLVVHTGYRIIGEKENVVDALRKGHVGEETINEILNTLITYQNKDTEPYSRMLQEDLDKCSQRKI